MEELHGIRYESGSFSLINVGSGFHCLRSFFFFFHKRLQRVIVVYGATHSQEDGVEGNRGSLMEKAEAFVLFLRSAGFAVYCLHST